jgi:hypothetical protein
VDAFCCLARYPVRLDCENEQARPFNGENGVRDERKAR